MPKDEWGVKRVCPETGRRFYDLNKDPIVSPYTGESYPASFFALDKSKTTMADKADKDAVKTATEDDLGDDVEILDDEDEGAEVDLGDELLEEEDEDTVPLEEVANVASEDDEG